MKLTEKKEEFLAKFDKYILEFGFNDTIRKAVEKVLNMQNSDETKATMLSAVLKIMQKYNTNTEAKRYSKDIIECYKNQERTEGVLTVLAIASQLKLNTTRIVAMAKNSKSMVNYYFLIRNNICTASELLDNVFTMKDVDTKALIKFVVEKDTTLTTGQRYTIENRILYGDTFPSNTYVYYNKYGMIQMFEYIDKLIDMKNWFVLESEVMLKNITNKTLQTKYVSALIQDEQYEKLVGIVDTSSYYPNFEEDVEKQVFDFFFKELEKDKIGNSMKNTLVKLVGVTKGETHKYLFDNLLKTNDKYIIHNLCNLKLNDQNFKDLVETIEELANNKENISFVVSVLIQLFKEENKSGTINPQLNFFDREKLLPFLKENITSRNAIFYTMEFLNKRSLLTKELAYYWFNVIIEQFSVSDQNILTILNFASSQKTHLTKEQIEKIGSVILKLNNSNATVMFAKAFADVIDIAPFEQQILNSYLKKTRYNYEFMSVPGANLLAHAKAIFDSCATSMQLKIYNGENFKGIKEELINSLSEDQAKTFLATFLDNTFYTKVCDELKKLKNPVYYCNFLEDFKEDIDEITTKQILLSNDNFKLDFIAKYMQTKYEKPGEKQKEVADDYFNNIDF